MNPERHVRLLRRARLLAAALAPACTHHAHRPPARAPTGGRVVSEAYYDAGGALPAPLQRSFVDGHHDVRAERILLPPRVPADLLRIPLATDPIDIYHVRPAGPGGGPRPLIVLSPILGNTNLLVDTFARGFARRGWHAAIVQRKELAFDPETSVRDAEQEVRLLVMRGRQAVDWLLAQPEVDAARAGTFGISAGGIVSSMLAGADARLGVHVWMLSGGPLADVMVDTCEERFREYARAVLRRSPHRRRQVRDSLRDNIRTDPLHLAAGVDPARVLLVQARFDRSVPYRYGLAHWRALGRPERIICPFGHYTTFLLLPWLRRKAFEHNDRHFHGGEHRAGHEDTRPA